MTEKQIAKMLHVGFEVYFRGLTDNRNYRFLIVSAASSHQQSRGEYVLHVPEESEYEDWYLKKYFRKERKNMVAIIGAFLFEAAYYDESVELEYYDFKKKYGEEK